MSKNADETLSQIAALFEQHASQLFGTDFLKDAARILQEYLRPRRPYTGACLCGRCDFTYVEDIACGRRCLGWDDGTLAIEGHYTTQGYDEDGRDPRIVCDHCGAEFSVPTEYHFE